MKLVGTSWKLVDKIILTQTFITLPSHPDIKFLNVLLYNILQIIFKEINHQENVNPLKSFTLPSLAKNVFRTNYLEEEIVNIDLNIDKIIRQAYFGGVNEVYKPVIKNGFLYDINSLFPNSMLKEKPKGTPIHVKGTIDLDDFFGFVNVKIESPKDKKIPF